MLNNNISITVFEHQPLVVGQPVGIDKEGKEVRFDKPHLKLLQQFYNNRDEEKNYYSLINDGVKFKQFVGVLNVGGLQIEVLPKTDNSTDNNTETWKKHLIAMLSAVYKLQAHAPTNAQQQLKNSSVLDVFLQRFLEEVEKLLHVGLIKTYRKEIDNRNSLKGKIAWNKHLTKNAVHKERFYVTYTTYDRNHVMNRVLLKTLQVIPGVTSNSYIANRAKTLAFEFPELIDITVTEQTFATMQFDRKSEGYHDAMSIAKLILLNYMPDSKNQSHNVIALMFDMNKLWEEYVYVMLRRHLVNCEVTAQKRKTLWRDIRGNTKTIKPDIVIEKKVTDENDETKPYIIDTKWKRPDGKPSDADLHQLYTYLKLFDAKKVAFVYPATSQKENIVDGYFIEGTNTKLSCDMIFLKLFNESQNKGEDFVKPIKEWLSKTPMQE